MVDICRFTPLVCCLATGGWYVAGVSALSHVTAPPCLRVPARNVNGSIGREYRATTVWAVAPAKIVAAWGGRV